MENKNRQKNGTGGDFKAPTRAEKKTANSKIEHSDLAKQNKKIHNPRIIRRKKNNIALKKNAEKWG